jgi:methionyl-tRNA formyltransferase
LIQLSRLGTVNVHASLLPRYRGPAPIEWAILNGDSETGVTVMQMDAGVDTGPILAQQTVPISSRDTAAQLEQRLAEVGATLLVSALPKLERGAIEARPQPSEKASHAPRLKSEDGKLDPNRMSAIEIDRRVRALGERVGTWMPVHEVQVKIFGGHPDGREDGVAVETADGIYVVEEVQPPGGRRMRASDWLRGQRR